MRRIHIRESLVEDLCLSSVPGVKNVISVRKLVKAAHPHSGLSVAIKTILREEYGGKWWSAWLILIAITGRMNWYRIALVFWK